MSYYSVSTCAQKLDKKWACMCLNILIWRVRGRFCPENESYWSKTSSSHAGAPTPQLRYPPTMSASPTPLPQRSQLPTTWPNSVSGKTPPIHGGIKVHVPVRDLAGRSKSRALGWRGKSTRSFENYRQQIQSTWRLLTNNYCTRAARRLPKPFGSEWRHPLLSK